MIELPHQDLAEWALELRAQAKQFFLQGVAAADPERAVRETLNVSGQALDIRLDSDRDTARVRSGEWSHIHLLAFGKAAVAMSRAALALIPPAGLAEPAIAITNYENETPLTGCEVIGASHPLPDAAGLAGAKRIAERVAAAQTGELVLVLVSGGGSALLPYPAGKLTLADKAAATEVLLACGATINEINCVRKHLSALKGGGLVRLAAPADVHALILSDVLGDELSAIASGPTVADPSTYADAMAVFQSRGAWGQLPEAVRAHLQAGVAGAVSETPKPGDSLFDTVGHTLVGSNRISVDAVMAAAQAAGFEPQLYSDALCGEAREVAQQLVMHAASVMQQATRPLAIIAGGETTVTVRGDGQGGRNQELALAFAIAAEQQSLPPRWVFLSGGTDGRDGPTDAAGGLVDPWTIRRVAAIGVEAEDFLDNNDSYLALKGSGDLLDTGATGTNVADLQVLLIQPRA